MSHSMYRRRRWRTFATTLALTLGSLTIPAIAMADGQLDPAYNGGAGYRLGTGGEMFSNIENRIPMVVQADGRIIAGGSRGNAMTLVRYNVNGTIDTTFGPDGTGYVTRQYSGTAAGTLGNSGAVAMTLDGANIVVAGFGGSQSIFAARFSGTNGAFISSAVCYAPHLIDYSARAVAVRSPGGPIVLAGYARDRHGSQAIPPTPNVVYGMRAVVTLPASGNSTTACGATNVPQQGSAGVMIDGLDHAGLTPDPTLSGRWYEGVAATATNYTVVSTTGPDGAAWVQRFTNAGGLDATFNGTGRVAIGAADFHAVTFGADGSAYAAGEAVAATAADRQMLVARILPTGAMGAFGTGGIARMRVGGGNNTGEAIAIQGGNIIVAGAANLAGRASFGVGRFTAAGVPDGAFGTGGQTATPIGTPQINAYITGLGIYTAGGNSFVAVAGRGAADITGTMPVVTGRYYNTGFPPPPVPAPVATTLGTDQITSTSARVGGTVNTYGVASSWWIEYGPTAAYGSQTATQATAGSSLDASVSATLTGLASGTTYHARVVITNSQGTDPGDDVTFTTLGAPAPPAPPAAGGGTTTPIATGGTATAVKKAAKKRQCIVPKVTGKKLNKARTTVFAKGCKVQVKYVKSKKVKNTVLAQSRKAGKKLGFRAVVKLTVATKAVAKKA